MKHVMWCLAAMVACAGCDPGGGGGDKPDAAVPVDSAVRSDGGLDSGPTDGGVHDLGVPDQGGDARPADQGPDGALPDGALPDHGPGPAPRRAGRLQWTGGPHGRGLPTFDYTGAGVRLRGSLTP